MAFISTDNYHHKLMFMGNYAARRCLLTQHLKALPGYAGQEAIVAHMIQVCCDAAYVILWNGSFWGDKERHEVADVVKRFLLNAGNLDEGYAAFIQRLLLARHHLYTKEGLVIQTPDAWFDERNRTGFNRTAVMFDAMEERRRERPLYRIGFKGFADALIGFAEEPSAVNFHYWRNYFAERNSQHLLNLFLCYSAYITSK